jgi:hypothetical protein
MYLYKAVISPINTKTHEKRRCRKLAGEKYQGVEVSLNMQGLIKLPEV